MTSTTNDTNATNALSDDEHASILARVGHKEPSLQVHRASAAHFFSETTRPACMDTYESQLATFVAAHVAAGRAVAVVTSGGTTVPLEKNTVRFLDNFSGGNRGSASVEYFLSLGYAVVFVHRRASAAPFVRHVQHALATRYMDLAFLEQLHVHEQDGTIVLGRPGPGQSSTRSAIAKVASVVGQYAKVQAEGLLLPLEFVSIVDYLFLLRSVALAVRPLGARALFYFAAAVSDFYIPESEQETHKIQSRAGPLEMVLPQTPKLLGVLQADWAPEAFCVSFKLETDAELLLPKARSALEKYDMDAVVANELHTRNDRVTVVTKSGVHVISREDFPDEPSELHPTGAWEIEEPLIKLLASAHQAKYEASASE